MFVLRLGFRLPLPSPTLHRSSRRKVPTRTVTRAAQGAADAMAGQRLPALFLAHGGGPLPLIGDSSHKSLIAHWKSLRSEIAEQYRDRIKAVVVVSAHWESDSGPTVTNWAGPHPLLFDYYNFPKETYAYKYNAPGDPQLAQRIVALLGEKGISAKTDDQRGFDHGVFVPLLALMPEADVPVLAMSLVSSLDPQEHIDIGKALAPLRDEGVLLIGSGLSFHSMRALMSGQGGSQAKEFDKYLQGAVTAATPEEREEKLEKWLNAPHARFCHPREEHLVPLFVTAGAGHDGTGKVIFSDTLMGASVSSFQFD